MRFRTATGYEWALLLFSIVALLNTLSTILLPHSGLNGSLRLAVAAVCLVAGVALLAHDDSSALAFRRSVGLTSPGDGSKGRSGRQVRVLLAAARRTSGASTTLAAIVAATQVFVLFEVHALGSEIGIYAVAALMVLLFLVARFSDKRRRVQVQSDIVRAISAGETAHPEIVEPAPSISEAMHDTLGRDLAVMHIYSSVLLESDTSATSPTSRDAVQGIVDAVGSARDHLQALYGLLSDASSHNSAASLTPTLDSLVVRFRKAFDAIGCELDVEVLVQDDVLDITYNPIIDAFIGEGFTNALKYSAPGAVHLLVKVDDRSIYVEMTNPVHRHRVRDSWSQLGLRTVKLRFQTAGGEATAKIVGSQFVLRGSLPHGHLTSPKRRKDEKSPNV